MSSQIGQLSASDLLRRPLIHVDRRPPQRDHLNRFSNFLSSLSGGNRFAFTVIGGLTFISLSIWYLQPSDHGRALADLLARQGYYEIATPAELYVPGTINTIEVRSDGKVELHPTCKADARMLAKITMKSRTVDHDLALGLNKKFDVSGKMQNLVSATIGSNRSAKLDMSLQNSYILLATDEDLVRLQHELVKDTCQEAIELNIKNGGIVCQTRAALKGDLVYDVNYTQELAIEERGKLTTELAGTLNLSADQDRADRMQGNGLIYGIKLMPTGIISNDPTSAPTRCPSPGSSSSHRRARQT